MMNLPENFNIKKGKKKPEFIEISGTVIRNVSFGIVGLVVVVVAVIMTPWEELKTSLVSPEKAVQQELLEEIKEMSLALRAIQQKDSAVKSGHEYLLAKDLSGMISFMIHENTCANGARIIVRLRDEFRDLDQPQIGSIQIMGIAAKKQKSVYSAAVTVNDLVPAQMRNLPNSMILDDETAFLTYQIKSGENADRVEYKIECY